MQCEPAAPVFAEVNIVKKMVEWMKKSTYGVVWQTKFWVS